MKRISRVTSFPNPRKTANGNNSRVMRRLIFGLATSVLLSGGLGVAGLAGAVGTAAAWPGPLPKSGGWPGCPDDPKGPCHWCPGDPPVQTGNLRVNPVIWDSSICHTYYYVLPGQGNVSSMIWDGEDPPAPPPPPTGLYCDPGTFFGNCRIADHP